MSTDKGKQTGKLLFCLEMRMGAFYSAEAFPLFFAAVPPGFRLFDKSAGLIVKIFCPWIV
jgi:hypothetical protein